MSVSDGENADAANFNAAFWSREIDTSTVGKVDLNETSSTVITDLQGTLNSEFTEIDSLRTLSGTTIGDNDQGTFTGSTITDNVTTKVALQELETEVELKEDSANKGIANGYASLDGSILVPEAQIPTHIGEITGQTSLLLDKTAISNQSTVTPVTGDFVLIGDTSDTNNLKKVDVVDLNATHTGEVTGATALTVDKTTISNKSIVTAVSGDFVLIGDTSDSDNLKKVDANDFISAGIADGIESVQVFIASGTWTKPAGINRVVVEVGGAGGEGAEGDATPPGANGNNGGTSSFGAHASATGGVGGTGSRSSAIPNGGAGGTGSSGDYNITGQTGIGAEEASQAFSPGGQGGMAALGLRGKGGVGGGGGGSGGAAAGGGGGGASVKLIDVSAISSETVTIGAGGTGGGAAEDGQPGIVIVWEYK